MIIITGGAGFIGSNLVAYLNRLNIKPIVVDTLTDSKWKNLSGLAFHLLSPSVFNSTIDSSAGSNPDDILVHLGANVDTTEPYNDQLWKNNFDFTIAVAQKFQTVIYASSGAVYGPEEKNFTEGIYGLKQLNAYAFSKWAVDESFFGISPRTRPKNLYSLRFFNVYGPNETHKGDMQSVVSKAINKLKPLYKGRIPDFACKTYRDKYTLFRSHREGVEHGEQKRDFIYVQDIADVIYWLTLVKPESGIYNLGSGKARSFNDIIKIVSPNGVIEYVPMPDVLRPGYQYFTEANMDKLRKAGYTKEFTSLEEGIRLTKGLTLSPTSSIVQS